MNRCGLRTGHITTKNKKLSILQGLWNPAVFITRTALSWDEGTVPWKLRGNCTVTATIMLN